ncbi:nucleoside hydrolase [candidate division KSB3 bacterium]|uniref:Nucleoside hydrolase n=1 Tax=candidate division KSB3 bacterium TaxID=2044937 RepID=A0A2G6E302_9BACT|nr:MAG: nucleoside hydrolase [candidate division KSB3 bacterium]PIE28913.1 MAG: nucleoside hydrolase [candidate division KSB3 bacterium]
MKSVLWCLVVLLLVLIPCISISWAQEKVILDTDMVELYDDGVAMMMLANSDAIDLLGVVTVSGNVWEAEATAYALRQLEIIDRPDIPVYAGARHPLRAGRYETMKTERELFGQLGWMGAFNRPEPASYLELEPDRVPYGGYPALKPQDLHGVQFLIDTIKANPGEVTIVAIGPLTNIALAVRLEPEITSLVKRIVYMGGALDVPGNMTPAAEFNWWFDPEAAKMSVRAPFSDQLIVGLDVCEKYLFTREIFDRISAVETPLTTFFKEKYGPRFEKDADYTRLVWDTIAAAVTIDPSLITEEETRWIDVNADYTVDYGRSLSYKKPGPVGTQKVRILFTIDEKRFWDLMVDLLTQ